MKPGAHGAGIQPSGGAAAGSGTPVGSAGRGSARRPDRYKWVALSNTTLAMSMATIDASIVIIALPAIFRGIQLGPFAPGNVS